MRLWLGGFWKGWQPDAECALQGIVYEGRKGGLSAQKAAFARPARDAELAQEAGTDLRRAVELVGPDSLIGAAAKGGAFSESVVKAVTKVLLHRSALVRRGNWHLWLPVRPCS